MNLAGDHHYPLAPGCIERIVLFVEYNGSRYHGWQKQASPSVATVQAVLEAAVAQVANHPVSLVCAGRTDAGVHAVGQVVHFDVAVNRAHKAWVEGVNSCLSPDVRVLSSCSVGDVFHARFSARSRRYQYWIQNTAVRAGIFDRLVTHVKFPLDVELMHSEAQCLLGEQDFSSFRGASCQSKTAMRNVHQLEVARHGDRVCIDITANAFLLHMVRNIAGSLIAIGSARQSPGWLASVLDLKDRTQAEVTAKPHGLYLFQVSYPEHFGLPSVVRPLYSDNR